MSQINQYYGNVNLDLLEQIPLSAKRIMEFGCCSVELAAAYKLSNPKCTYVGVEYVQSVVEQARQKLDHVICGNLEDLGLTLPLVENKKYDCLIYGDVLEHLRDPWSTLKRHLDLLADDGALLICLPNVQHWKVISNLLQGQWPLADRGLFDRTHLRWFTRDSIVQWLDSLGFSIYSFKPRIFAPEQSQKFVSQLLPALHNLKLDSKKVLEGVSPLQYVVSACRISKPSLVVDGFSTMNFASMVDVRLAQPFRALATQPCVQTKIHMHEIKLRQKQKGVQRILVWQRPILSLNKSDLDSIRTFLKFGYTIVMDWDDDPDHWPVLRAEDYVSFKMVHAIQVSKPELADMLRPLNPNIAVFVNMYEQVMPPKSLTSKQNTRGLRMFFGALNRENDWAPLMKELNRVFCLDPDFWSVSVVHDRAFYEALDLPPECKSFVPTCSHADYIKEMSYCDFAFLPLADNRFNRLKSDLKAVEAAANGLAVLASSVVYQSAVRDGITGGLFSSSMEMIQHLKDWRAIPEHVQNMGQNGYQWVTAERMTAYQVQQREDWYRLLASQHQFLTRQLIERVPQLAHSTLS